jgi:hypothetical protein
MGRRPAQQDKCRQQKFACITPSPYLRQQKANEIVSFSGARPRAEVCMRQCKLACVCIVQNRQKPGNAHILNARSVQFVADDGSFDRRFQHIRKRLAWRRDGIKDALCNAASGPNRDRPFHQRIPAPRHQPPIKPKARIGTFPWFVLYRSQCFCKLRFVMLGNYWLSPDEESECYRPRDFDRLPEIAGDGWEFEKISQSTLFEAQPDFVPWLPHE